MTPESQHDEVLCLLQDLVSLESHKDAPGREAAVGRYLVDWFGERGIPAQLQPVEGERANVVARLVWGEGPTLLLNGHLDTVPAGEMQRAFAPRIEDGVLWGRGACDMKGAIAAMCCALAQLHSSCESGPTLPRLTGQLVFVGTVDEETGSRGVKRLIESGFRADYAVVGEPTRLRVAVAHKGCCFLKVELIGRGAHGSCPERGVNAASYAARIAIALEDELQPRLVLRIHPLLGTSTVSIGRICGGSQPNIVAERCELLVDRRYLPEEEPPIDEVRGLVASICDGVAGLSYEITETAESATIPHGPLDTDPASVLVASASEAVGHITGRTEPPMGVTYWTDGGHLAASGIETIILGPGDIAHAHGPSERVAGADLVAATRIYQRMAMQLLGDDE